MLIFLKFIIGDTMVLEWDPSNYIHEIKDYIYMNIDIHCSQISLIFKGKEMDDFTNLMEYGIINQNAMIQVVLNKNEEKQQEINIDEVRRKVKEHGVRVYNRKDTFITMLIKILGPFRLFDIEAVENEQQNENNNSEIEEIRVLNSINKRELKIIWDNKRNFKVNKNIMKSKKILKKQVKIQIKNEWRAIKRSIYKQNFRSNHQKYYK